MQYLNLTELKQRGLLTDAEMRQVSSALARQMERREGEERRKQAARRANELELDPEIRRMEIQAEAARLARLQAQSARGGGLAAVPAVPVVYASQPPTASVDDADDDLWETLEDEPAEQGTPVEMPPDVVAMYESGIITEEEFEEARKKYQEQNRKQ